MYNKHHHHRQQCNAFDLWHSPIAEVLMRVCVCVFFKPVKTVLYLPHQFLPATVTSGRVHTLVIHLHFSGSHQTDWLAGRFTAQRQCPQCNASLSHIIHYSGANLASIFAALPLPINNSFVSLCLLLHSVAFYCSVSRIHLSSSSSSFSFFSPFVHNARTQLSLLLKLFFTFFFLFLRFSLFLTIEQQIYFLLFFLSIRLYQMK